MTFGYQQQHWAETPYDTRDPHFGLNVEPMDRVGTLPPNRTKARLRAIFVCSVLLGGAWAFSESDPERAESLIASAKSFLGTAVSKVQEIASRAQQETASVSTDASSPPVEPTGSSIPFGPSEGLVPEIPEAQTETVPATSEELAKEPVGTTYAETAEPAEDAADKSPQRKQAIAAGLGPDLPNVLLTRLSKGDLKNAEYAIRTALAKTADDAKFSWPLKPTKQQALFEVRFVAGAAEGCRRYIVTVTKDRWTSTSAALEKCNEAHASAG
jgi:hypothetical protein